MAEIVAYYFPKLVDVHNYSPANCVVQKTYNWNTLNQKVFSKIDFNLHPQDIKDVANAAPNVIERVLAVVQLKMAAYKKRFFQNSNQQIVQDDNVSDAETNDFTSNNKKEALLIRDLEETVQVMAKKIAKLEELVHLKDTKIEHLAQKLAAIG
eukprot:Platyproteum_vivax@DN2264_c0_g1_i1.p1